MQDHGAEFRNIALGECLSLAQGLQAAGKKWHSHVLSPGCHHNPYPEAYAIVIEDDTDTIAYMAKGDATFPAVDKDLVRMLHGDDILEASAVTANPPRTLLIDHLHRLQERGLPWHHHMHFPSCTFNPHPGQWSISVEAPDCFMSEAYADEPADVLRQVEVLYFGNLEKQS